VSAANDPRYIYGDQGLAARRNIDPLTDSASHRLGLGTQVRLHLYGELHADVGLLAIRDCSNWDDLSARIERGLAIEVLASRRRVFAGGVVLWAEVLSDALEETPEGS
jgi:hypothetical protein